jgi:hypothetical protein
MQISDTPGERVSRHVERYRHRNGGTGVDRDGGVTLGSLGRDPL